MLNGLNEIVNPSLRERIDKTIAGKLFSAEVNFGFSPPMKAKENPKSY